MLLQCPWETKPRTIGPQSWSHHHHNGAITHQNWASTHTANWASISLNWATTLYFSKMSHTCKLSPQTSKVNPHISNNRLCQPALYPVLAMWVVTSSLLSEPGPDKLAVFLSLAVHKDSRFFTKILSLSTESRSTPWATAQDLVLCNGPSAGSQHRMTLVSKCLLHSLKGPSHQIINA